MKKPLLYAGIFVLAGTACGISETPGIVKAAAFFGCLFLLCVGGFYKGGARLKRALLLAAAGLFIAGFIRGAAASYVYNTKESREFFLEYEARNPGEFDYSMYLKAMGIENSAQLDAYYDSREITWETADTPLKKLKLYCINAFDSYLEEEDAGIYKAVVLGVRSGIDEELTNLFRKGGISHLLAVSGLHVGIIGAGVMALTGLFGAGKTASCIISSAAVFFYMLLCGSQSSSMRAACMLILSFAATAKNRTYSMGTAISVSAIIIMFMKPYQIFYSGFQLSFCAVAGAAFAGNNFISGIEKFRERKSRLKKEGVNKAPGSSGKGPGLLPPVKRAGAKCRLGAFTKTIIISASIQLTTLPVTAYNYYTFPVYAILLNLVAVPLMCILVYSGFVVILFSVPAYFCGGFSVLPYLAAAPGHYLIRFYKFLCEMSLRIPYSTVCMGKPELRNIILYYALLFLIVYAVFNLNRITYALKMPGVMAAVLAAALIIANADILKYREDRDFYVYALYAGQGDSFVIKDGSTYITVDGGSTSDGSFGEDVLEAFLLSKRITGIDMAIISHADKDHTSGILYIMEESGLIEVKGLVLPSSAENEEYDGLKEAFLNSGAGGNKEKGRVTVLKNLQNFYSSGDVSLTCIYAGNTGSADTNRQSSVVLLEKGSSFSMLFTGDMSSDDDEEVMELYKRYCGSKSRLTVLKAAHHGSRTSTSAYLLDALRPAYALLSYGENNSYGHPSDEVLERLGERGIGIMSTCINGAVLIDECGFNVFGNYGNI